MPKNNLEQLVYEKPQYKGKGKLGKVNRIRIVTAVRYAIKMSSEENDINKLVPLYLLVKS